MPFTIQIDDQAYAVAKAFAEQAHCSIASAVSSLVVKSGASAAKTSPPPNDATIRFPLAHGARAITPEMVARLEDEG